ncbi:MAG: hypothetical protein BWZ10_02378 [candidate division BRC1 bacterium ADurb.BinA364]|nr:MAG: hypothetical protein BWZ10_02378 [candidate division BRC1 bacterium ADurb.BinA364]
MNRACKLVGALLVFGSLTAASWGQQVALLAKKYENRLNEKAHEIYKAGVEQFDKINYDAAILSFYQAMKADPQHIKLRFLVADLAHRRGKMTAGAKTVEYYTMAKEALSGLISRTDLRSEDRRRAETHLEEIERDTGNISFRDSRRDVTGKQIIKEIVAEREKFTGLRPLGLESPASEEATGAAGAAGATGGTTAGQAGRGQGQGRGQGNQGGAGGNPAASSRYM